MGTPIKIFDLSENVFIDSTTLSTLPPQKVFESVFKMFKFFIAITLVLVVGALATPQKAADVKAPKEEPKAAETPAQVPEAPAKTPVAPPAPTKAVDEKPVDQKPAVPEKPVVDEEPVVAEKPVVAVEPVVAEKPVVTEKPVITEKPAVAEKPAVTEKPVIAEKPVAAEKPITPEKPVAVEEPVAAEEPVVAEKPAINSADRTMCSVKSASHLECLKNANFDPSELMKCGQTILSCLSDRWNVEKWW